MKVQHNYHADFKIKYFFGIFLFFFGGGDVTNYLHQGYAGFGLREGAAHTVLTSNNNIFLVFFIIFLGGRYNELLLN